MANNLNFQVRKLGQKRKIVYIPSEDESDSDSENMALEIRQRYWKQLQLINQQTVYIYGQNFSVAFDEKDRSRGERQFSVYFAASQSKLLFFTCLFGTRVNRVDFLNFVKSVVDHQSFESDAIVVSQWFRQSQAATRNRRVIETPPDSSKLNLAVLFIEALFIPLAQAMIADRINRNGQFPRLDREIGLLANECLMNARAKLNRFHEYIQSYPKQKFVFFPNTIEL